MPKTKRTNPHYAAVNAEAKRTARKATVRKTTRKPVSKSVSKRIQKSKPLVLVRKPKNEIEKLWRNTEQHLKRKVDKKALRIITKIETRVEKLCDHVRRTPARDNIRYIHASELLTIVRMMRKKELAGWID